MKRLLKWCLRLAVVLGLLLVLVGFASLTTVDRTRGADGLVDSTTTGPKGAVTTVDRTRNADGTVNRVVTTTPPGN